MAVVRETMMATAIRCRQRHGFATRAIANLYRELVLLPFYLLM
jgi:hypothetical protein